MRILPISFTTPNIALRKKQENISNPIEQSEKRNVFAYQDYNISFMGRTPEDFYAQDFNRKNMPRTMRDYLDYDYNTRQHIPPEQMMAEVFKYIDKVDNFEYVKGLYPEEDLFKDLHENNIKSRKGILSEIAVVKELGTEPLLKNGSDNFGMYLLRKIYLEGKTLKEISKDFYENDLNDEYKEYIKEPITYSTLSAYGIKYPKQAFWHSFIHTRDEYKKFFVTLPKDSYAPGVNKSGLHSGTHSAGNAQEDDTPRPRKHIMKSHERTNLENDLNKGPIDEDGVKRAVRKRFGKDDPQASFIIKYMSPIMTVAAERIHLSEEMKIFTEDEKLNGKSSNEKTMFGRFWKQNPELRKQYSRSIVDTIDMFEDIYGGGGNIPINAQLEKISNPKNPNNKILDYVSGEFLDLLTYAQGIEGNRNARYAHHDHIERLIYEYSIPRHEKKEITTQQIQPEEVVEDLSPDEFVEQLAAENNASVYKLRLINGETASITGNTEEALEIYLKYKTQFMPSKYAQKYIDFIRNNPEVDEKYKLSLSITQILNNIDDPQVLSKEELKDKHSKIDYSFLRRNINEEICANNAINDFISIKFGHAMPELAYTISTYDYPDFINAMLNPDEKQAVVIALRNGKDQINEMYDNYTKPLTKQESNKVTDKYITMLYNYKPDNDSLLDDSSLALILMLKDSIMNDKPKRTIFRKFLQRMELNRHTYSKSLLDSRLSDEKKLAKFELSMSLFVDDLIYGDNDADNLFLTLINRRVYEKYKHKLEPDVQYILDKKISNLPLDTRLRFNHS